MGYTRGPTPMSGGHLEKQPTLLLRKCFPNGELVNKRKAPNWNEIRRGYGVTLKGRGISIYGHIHNLYMLHQVHES
jgi:hypothetical protein